MPKTPRQLDHDIAGALRGRRSSSRHATARGSAGPADLRQQFVDAFLALQRAFGEADEVVAKAHNRAVHVRGNAAALAKLKTAANRMEKALRDYGEEVDELLGQLEY